MNGDTYTADTGSIGGGTQVSYDCDVECCKTMEPPQEGPPWDWCEQYYCEEIDNPPVLPPPANAVARPQPPWRQDRRLVRGVRGYTLVRRRGW